MVLQGRITGIVQCVGFGGNVTFKFIFDISCLIADDSIM